MTGNDNPYESPAGSRAARTGFELQERLENELKVIKTAIATGNINDASEMLAGLCVNAPPGGEFSKEIGDLFYAMGFSAMAGRYWYFLSDRSDQMVAACKDFERSLGNSPVLIFQEFSWVSGRSPQINAKVLELKKSAEQFNQRHQYDVKAQAGWGNKVALLGCGIVAFLVIFVFVMGVRSILGLPGP
jgi:hypothetical protein